MDSPIVYGRHNVPPSKQLEYDQDKQLATKRWFERIQTVPLLTYISARTVERLLHPHRIFRPSYLLGLHRGDSSLKRPLQILLRRRPRSYSKTTKAARAARPCAVHAQSKRLHLFKISIKSDLIHIHPYLNQKRGRT